MLVPLVFVVDGTTQEEVPLASPRDVIPAPRSGYGVSFAFVDTVTKRVLRYELSGVQIMAFPEPSYLTDGDVGYLRDLRNAVDALLKEATGHAP